MNAFVPRHLRTSHHVSSRKTMCFCFSESSQTRERPHINYYDTLKILQYTFILDAYKLISLYYPAHIFCLFFLSLHDCGSRHRMFRSCISLLLHVHIVFSYLESLFLFSFQATGFTQKQSRSIQKWKNTFCRIEIKLLIRNLTSQSIPPRNTRSLLCIIFDIISGSL